MVKLSEFAKKHGISYKTAYNKYKQGIITGIELEGNKKPMILVDENQFDTRKKESEKKKIDFIDQAINNISEIPDGNSTLENLEACVKISKFLIYKELKQEIPDKKAINDYLKTLLQSTKYMLDCGVDEEQSEEELIKS